MWAVSTLLRLLLIIQMKFPHIFQALGEILWICAGIFYPKFKEFLFFSAIDQLNSYTIPPGTENSCLVFFSGRSAQDFAGCRPVDTQKFKYTFGVAINGLI